jgi:hypothetical protein
MREKNIMPMKWKERHYASNIEGEFLKKTAHITSTNFIRYADAGTRRQI